MMFRVSWKYLLDFSLYSFLKKSKAYKKLKCKIKQSYYWPIHKSFTLMAYIDLFLHVIVRPFVWWRVVHMYTLCFLNILFRSQHYQIEKLRNHDTWNYSPLSYLEVNGEYVTLCFYYIIESLSVNLWENDLNILDIYMR